MDAAHAFPRPLASAPARWRDRLEQAVLQEPLLFTQPSLAALSDADRRTAPNAVMVGIGLCTPDALTTAMPFDVLGLLLPAERIRRALDATTVVALVADTHAHVTGFEPSAIECRARAAVHALIRLRARLDLQAMCVVRASRLHATTRYREWLRTVQARAGTDVSSYLVRQVADVACLDDRLGGIVKLGWMVGRDRDDAIGDEAAFDRWVGPWSRRRPLFAYARAGRTLDPTRLKAPPYIELDPGRRVTLAPGERVADKLAAATDLEARNGVENHLRAIGNTFARTVAPVPGPAAARAQRILDRLYRPIPG
jgi:hypothetical protein